MRRILFGFIILSFISCSSINWETHTDKVNKYSIQYLPLDFLSHDLQSKIKEQALIHKITCF